MSTPLVILAAASWLVYLATGVATATVVNLTGRGNRLLAWAVLAWPLVWMLLILEDLAPGPEAEPVPAPADLLDQLAADPRVPVWVLTAVAEAQEEPWT